MAEGRDRKARRIFLTAVELDEPERAAFLERECGSDANLRREVERLLAADALNAQDATGREFMEPPTLPGEPSPHHVLGDDYQLQEVIGRGGFGTVYRARQLSLQRDVAVKVLLHDDDGDGDDAVVQRFHAEAERIARIRHPGIVQVITNGRDGPLHWFAMELVQGADLRQELTRLASPRPNVASSRLPAFGTGEHIVAVARICADAAEALHAAHRNGIVHRDIKPSNLLLDADHRIRVADFGIARDDRYGTLTRSHEILGSASYMSPEQARISSHAVDHRTDVYSLGVVLYQLLTLELPFAGESVQQLSSRIRRANPVAVRARNRRVPQDVEVICLKAIQRDPDDRFQDCAELADDLRRFLNHEAILARPPALTRRVRQFVRRHRAALVPAAVVAGGVAVAIAILAAADRRREIERLLHSVASVPLDRELGEVAEAALFAARRDGAALRARLDELDATEARLVSDHLARIDGHLDSLRQSAFAVLLPSSDVVTTVGTFDIEQAFEAYDRLRRVAVITGNSELEQLPPNPLLPRLTIEGIDDPGITSVMLATLDEITGNPGPAVDLGPPPIRAIPIPPRACRVTIRAPGRPLREFTRLARLGDWAVRIEVPASGPESTTAMVSFPTTEVTFPLQVGPDGEPTPHSQPLAGRTIRIPAFAIDVFEVTIGQYREFLAATGHPPPPHFEFLPADVDERLPITFVSWHDAQSYAEWVGKRLPTLAEWTFAARGRAMRPFPYAADDPNDVRGNVLVRDQSWRDDQSTAARTRQFLTHARPVDSFREAASPEGVFNLFGNVGEWIEGPYPDGSHPDYVRSDRHAVLGSYWTARRIKKDLNGEPALRGPGPDYAFMAFGFRCARSLVE